MQSDETLETWGKIVVKCIEFLIHLRFQFAQDRRLQNELHVPENQDRAFPAMIENGNCSNCNAEVGAEGSNICICRQGRI